MKPRRIKGLSASPAPKQPRGERAPRAPFVVDMSVKHSWSRDEKAVLRDIWLYAAMLFGVGSVITIVFSGFAPLLVWPVFMMLALACFFGALILHLDTLDRWARARRKGEKPDLTRIFD